MIEHTVRLHSRRDPESGLGAFVGTSFSEWIGHEVVVTSLDPAMRHVLRAVENTSDGLVATLTIQTYDHVMPNLSADLSVFPGTPKAQVRAHLHDNGQHLVTTHLDAPLQPGQQVTLNGALHTVQDVAWPYRDPANAETVEDYQHVTLRPVAEAPVVQSLGVVDDILGTN